MAAFIVTISTIAITVFIACAFVSITLLRSRWSEHIRRPADNHLLEGFIKPWGDDNSELQQLPNLSVSLLDADFP
jgi:cell division protein FtsW (lipid II flippase)